MNIGIIGGGAAAVAAALQLSQSAQKTGLNDSRIVIFEKNKKCGPGLVYSTTLNTSLLNMRADTMSVIANEPLHFLHWLEYTCPNGETSYDLTHGRFPSRCTYGKYLSFVLDDLKNSSPCTIETITGEALAIEESGSKQ